MKRILILIAACACVTQSFANDSSIGTENPELQYIQTEAIHLKREDLYLSPGLVTVDYEFENLTDQDIELTLAFPVEEIWLSDGDTSFVVPSREDMSEIHALNPEDFEFATTIHGKPAPSRYQRLAMLQDQNVTPFFEKRSLDPFSQNWYYNPKEMAGAAYQDMQEMGLLAGDEPQWKKQHIWIWDARFPAGQITKVHHEYFPSLSGSFGGGGDFDPKFCADQAFQKGIKKRFTRDEDTVFFIQNELVYLLGPGRNWQGSIDELNVTIDKQGTDALVSFCADGVEKISPTKFTFQRLNYEPKTGETLDILFAH